MSSRSPQNTELKDLEGFLDNELGPFEGSNAWDTLNGIYENLDGIITEYTDRIDELENENTALKREMEESA